MNFENHCRLTCLTFCNTKMTEAPSFYFHYWFTFLSPHRFAWFLKCQILLFPLRHPILHIVT